MATEQRQRARRRQGSPDVEQDHAGTTPRTTAAAPSLSASLSSSSFTTALKTTNNLVCGDAGCCPPLRTILQQRRKQQTSKWMTMIDCLGVFIAIGIVVLCLMFVWEVIIPTRPQRIYYSVLATSLVPVVLAAWTIVRPRHSSTTATTTTSEREVRLHQRLFPFVLVAAIVSGMLPSWINKAVAAMVLFLFGWMTRPLSSSSKSSSSSSLSSQKKKDSPNAVKSKLSDDEATHNDTDPTTESAATGGSKSDTKNNNPNNENNSNNNNNKNEHNTTTSTTIKNYSGMSKQAQHNLSKAAVCAVILTLVMLAENFFIWVVSATFQKGWDPRFAPDPLQDNGRRVLQFVFYDALEMTKRQVVSLRRVWNVQYALVATLGTALVTVDFHPTRQLWSLGCRTLLTLASARSLRTISFLLTVLPSQNKFCYGQHFPNPPPGDWWNWFLVGLKPSVNGGCNDLIVSGHATVTATIACVAVSFAEDPLFSIAVWWLLAMDYAVEIFEGFHYSVDMWMGAVLVGLLWRVWKPMEDNNADRNDATLQDLVQRLRHDQLTVRDTIHYGIPVLIAFLQVTVLPEIVANPIIVAFIAFAVIPIKSKGFQQYTKHVFFCALYMTIGIYL